MTSLRRSGHWGGALALLALVALLGCSSDDEAGAAASRADAQPNGEEADAGDSPGGPTNPRPSGAGGDATTADGAAGSDAGNTAGSPSDLRPARGGTGGDTTTGGTAGVATQSDGTAGVAGSQAIAGMGGVGPVDVPFDNDMPAGIPAPAFGCVASSAEAATVFVDNTNPDCDNSIGSEQEPYCDLFRGENQVTYDAGSVVLVLGGPYPLDGDYTFVSNGTEGQPVVVRAQGETRMLFDGSGQRCDFSWQGSYARIENISFYHQTRHSIDGEHLVLQNVGVTNPPEALIDFNPVVNVRGHDIVVCRSEIGNNRRANDTDSHGIQAGAGSYNVWILDNEIYNNNGDAFQGCHECFDAPPHHVYIGRNVMHDDRENAVDLKTIHDVVVSENLMTGYAASETSGGDAMVVGSNGFDDAINMGPRRVWIVNNEFRGAATGIRLEGSEDVWIVGNLMTEVSQGIQIDDKPHRQVVIANNTISGTNGGVRAWGCQPDNLQLFNNILTEMTERAVDLSDCPADVLALENNLFWNSDGSFAVRIDGANHTSLTSLEALARANDNLFADPILSADTFQVSGDSPALDAGRDLEALLSQFESEWGASIRTDRAGNERPSGAAIDVGAFEAQ